MDGVLTLIMFFVLLFLGVPVAYTMIFTSGLYLLTNGFPILVMIQRMGNAMNSITLLAVPTFILAGFIMNRGGLTRHLFNAVNCTRIGKMRGGLAQVNVVASLIFAGMSGAALADLGGLGSIELQAMRDKNYKDDDAIAVTLASSAIGPIFPPSVPMLIYALVASVSGVKILLAGIVPGILLTLTLMAMVAYFARTRSYPRGDVSFTKKEARKIKLSGMPALIAPIILLSGLFSGSFSPTELACVAVVYSLFVGIFFYKGMNLKNFIAAAGETIDTVTNTLFILTGATIFAFVLTIEQVPQTFGNAVLSIVSSKIMLILLLNVVLLVVGMLMDTGTALLIFTPIFLPIMTRMGMDPIQLGIIMTLNLVIGLYTPPFGVCLFMSSTMIKRPVEKIVKAMTPYY
ncbi:MAG: TRAP transporter large permease, partial [Firmicutes bacterium]|nr:TRAP transporter large permease [Bacillota bacterium]